jgi:hypothetical protein
VEIQKNQKMNEKTLKILRGVSKAIQIQKRKKEASANKVFTPTHRQKPTHKANAGGGYA